MTEIKECINKEKVKILHWSFGADEWMHYGYFESLEVYFWHIKTNGYNPRYFKVDTD